MFGEVGLDLFASRETALCDQWFSINAQEAPPLDAFSHQPWPKALLYTLLIPLIPPPLTRFQEECLTVILIAPE